MKKYILCINICTPYVAATSFFTGEVEIFDFVTERIKRCIAAKRENMWDIFRNTHNDLCNYKLQNILASTPPPKKTATKKAPFRVLYFFTNLCKVLHMFRSNISMWTIRLMFGMLSKFSFCCLELVSS